MPARNSSMELSSPSNPEVDSSMQSSRRRSGRVALQPERASSDTSAKRKYATINGAEDSDAESESEDGDGEPDEEELKEKKRKARKVASGKPAAKRAKPTLDGPIPVRPAPSRAKKTKRAAPLAAAAGAQEIGGLYGRITSSRTFHPRAHSLLRRTLWPRRVFGQNRRRLG